MTYLSKESASRRQLLLLVLAPLLLLGFGLALFPSAGRDDAHIGYWVAQRLALTGHVINYNGEAIEQSSTLLHALVLAAADKLCQGKVAMVMLGRFSAVVFGIGAVLLTQRVASRIDRSLAPAAGLLTASTAYFVYWSFGGMEATLCALLALWLVWTCGDYLAAPNERLYHPRLLWAAIAILLFILVRPEQPLVLVCMLAGSAMFVFLRSQCRAEPLERQALNRIALLALISTLIVAAVFLWRWEMFGSLFPQPVSAKSGNLSADAIKAGLRYFHKQFIRERTTVLFVATTLVGLFLAVREYFRARRLDPHLLLATLFFISYAAFIILAGGDWMEAGRFFVPLLPVAAIFNALVVLRLARRHSRLGKVLAFALALGQIATFLRLAVRESAGMPAWAQVVNEPYATASQARNFTWFERHNRANLRDIPTIERLESIVTQLRLRNPEAPVRILSAQLGMVAYHIVGRHFGQVEIVDRRGLVDRKLTSCSELSHLSRGAGGLQLEYDFYFAHRAELEKACGLPRPDIIFDIGDVPAMPDYTVVYRQSGEVRTHSKWFPGRPFPASQFIAVRNDLKEEVSQAEE